MNTSSSLNNLQVFEEQTTVGISPWVLSLRDDLGEGRRGSRWSHVSGDFSFSLIEGIHSLWLLTRFPAGGEVALRVAYCPDGNIAIRDLNPIENGVEIYLFATIGEFCACLEFPQDHHNLLHSKTTLTPSTPLIMPFWPRDVIPLGEKSNLTAPEGMIYTSQIGLRTGLTYFSLTGPKAGAVLYFQNLTSLNDYCQQTGTSLAEVVGGEWPELGLALPTTTDKPLKAGQEITISDAYMIFSPQAPDDDLVMSRQFLELLTQVYLVLPRPATEYTDWLEIARNSLRDLSNSEKCWTEEKGQYYLNAYVGDSETPPESMVQLTVLLPLLEYADWSGEEVPITEDLLPGIPKFFDKKAGVLGRWLPSAAGRLDGSEPQKKPEVMDSWYLYHSLINLSRLALRGDKKAETLFLDSMEYCIKTAHEFNYRWPIFYDLYTLEVLKAESKEGEGGELDVAGLYAHVMLQAWELTKEERYLEEAKTAARTLKGLGFNLFYQANETLFGAGAMLRLWKITGDELFLNLSYLSLANAFNYMWLWECNYGYGEHYKTFFALFPLKGAPYTAVYEELEGFAALHDYLAQDEEDPPEWLKILIPEFIRNMLYKAKFYYPPNLPNEMLTKKPRTGEIDPKLWIPLEDIYDGWEKAGQVGQEVYGAGMPFGMIPRHYWRIPDEKFLIYVDYPTQGFSSGQKRQATFHVLGDPRLSCRMRLMPAGKAGLPSFEVQTEYQGNTETLEGQETPEGHIEYELKGDRAVKVHWTVDT